MTESLTAAEAALPPPPPLPGNHSLREMLYFTAASEDCPNGDRVEHGQRGEVMGPATHEPHRGKGLAIKFEGNKGAVDCYLDMLSREPPPSLTADRTPRPSGELLSDTATPTS